MNNKLIIRRSLKTIMTMTIKEAKRSALGELDIMMDSANGIPFEKVIAGDNYQHFENSVHAISWHGYYQISDQHTIQLPTIHFKDEMNRKWSYKDVKHIGTMNANEPFAFPLCSLYIPANFALLDAINASNYPANHKDLDYQFLDMTSDTNQRLDIFLTPKNVSALAVLNSKMGYAYKSADAPLYNTKEGLLILIKEIKDNPELDQNSLVQVVTLGNGHDLILRTVGDQQSMFNELEGNYSLLVHDPNDSLNRLGNRPYAVVEGDRIVETGLVKNTLPKIKSADM